MADLKGSSLRCSALIKTTLRQWLKDLNDQTAFIEPGSPWENGCIESFNGKLNRITERRDHRYDGGGTDDHRTNGEIIPPASDHTAL
jgi:transposase InsO family protein